ncbi:MAG: redoxin domain-containing protein [Armatimonadota bacterium]|nr:redoxin domain-containing protein [Armatimonadota bacterium]
MKRTLALLGLAIFTMGFAAAQTNIADELKNLQAAYDKELQAYYAAAQEKIDKGEAFDMTGGPAKAYLPKVMAIASRAKGTPTADKAYALAVQMGYTTSNPDAVVEAFEGMIANNPNSEDLKNSMMFIGFSVKPQDRALKLLSRVEHFSTNNGIKASAVMMRARMFYDDYSGEGDVKRAKGILERVIKNYPSTDAAKRAKNAIFAMENLGVGMTAPDFTATDQDGVTFKLSDYRGKVVVVDFWGFW